VGIPLYITPTDMALLTVTDF